MRVGSRAHGTGFAVARLHLSLWLSALITVVLITAAMTVLGAEKQAPAPPDRGKPGVVKLQGIEFDLKGKQIRMDGRISLGAGVVELFACIRGTKDYESVVALDCQPYDLHVGLLALGLKPGRPVSRQDVGGLPVGPTVLVRVEWKDKNGAVVRRRAEELIRNVKTNTPMEPAGWVFVGSQFIRAEEGGKELYAASVTGAVITTYHDPTTVLDNPRPTGGDDTLFVVDEKVVPPVGTPVVVIVEPETKKDASPKS